MHSNFPTRAIALGLAAFAGSAAAVNVNTNGIGQVLVYPYYTVNAGQQTLLTVVNTSDVGKAVKVRFLEAYDGRDVLTFNLFLSPRDVWSANVFKLSDAGLAGSGAGVFTADNSCTAPPLTQGPLGNGLAYQQFLDYAYVGAFSDTGPTGDDRTNEGHFEIIAMADIVAGSALSVDTQHVDSVPPGCSRAESDFESNAGTVPPTSGLFGSGSIVDVADGTFFAYNATALEGFTAVRLDTPTGAVGPNLASANDPCCTDTVTARQFIAGQTVTSVFPAARAIDAVSAVFAADTLYNEYVADSSGSTGTDWVITFPTKRFYVDPTTFGTTPPPNLPLPPFEHLFGAREAGNDLGLSCVVIGTEVFDREENEFDAQSACGFPECPPQGPPQSLCLETNVFVFQASSVLGSTLKPQASAHSLIDGMLGLVIDGNGHDFGASTNGNIFHGLPAIGFAVSRFVNGHVLLSGGGSAIANYSAAYPHRSTTNCTAINGPCS